MDPCTKNNSHLRGSDMVWSVQIYFAEKMWDFEMLTRHIKQWSATANQNDPSMGG